MKGSLLTLGLQMIAWLTEHELFGELYIRSDRAVRSKERYLLTFQPGTQETLKQFRRDFGIQKMVKSKFDETRLDYNVRIEAKNGTVLRVKAYAVSDLPPSCRIVKEEVWVEEKTVPEHIEEAHFETRNRMVCENGDEDES